MPCASSAAAAVLPPCCIRTVQCTSAPQPYLRLQHTGSRPRCAIVLLAPRHGIAQRIPDPRSRRAAQIPVVISLGPLAESSTTLPSARRSPLIAAEERSSMWRVSATASSSGCPHLDILLWPRLSAGVAMLELGGRVTVLERSLREKREETSTIAAPKRPLASPSLPLRGVRGGARAESCLLRLQLRLPVERRVVHPRPWREHLGGRGAG